MRTQLTLSVALAAAVGVPTLAHASETPPAGASDAAPASQPPPAAASSAAPPSQPPPVDLPLPAPCECGDRELTGHTFLFPALTQSAFVTTYVGIREGVYRESIPNLPLPFGNPATLNLLGILSDLDFAMKFTDWFGAAVSATALAVVGTSGESLVYAGGNVNAGGSVSPVFRLVRAETTGTQVSLRANVGWAAGDALDVPQLLVAGRDVVAHASSQNAASAASAIAQGLLQNGILRVAIQGADEFDVDGSLHAAQAFGDMFGLQAAVTFRRRVIGLTTNTPGTGDSRDSATRYDALLDVSVEWDGASQQLPLALMAEYQLNARLGGIGNEELEQESNTVHTVGLGAYYSGARNLQFGVFGATVLHLRPISAIAGVPGASNPPWAEYLQLVLRYVW